MKDPDISEVAKQSGVPASTLRYYEEKGLIASNGRRGLKRTFDPDVFEKLGLIALGRASGFTLAQARIDHRNPQSRVATAERQPAGGAAVPVPSTY